MKKVSLPIEPAPKKRGDKSAEVFPKCGICYSVVDETYTCKECGVEFCKDCGNPMALVCTNCEDEEEEEKPKKAKK